MSNEYVYCFIRKDLSVAQQIIQMSHCTWEAGTFAKAGKHSPNFVLFEVENEFELISITEYLCDHIIDYSAFRESWLGGEFTSICTEPLTCSNKRALFKEFKMYGK